MTDVLSTDHHQKVNNLENKENVNFDGEQVKREMLWDLHSKKQFHELKDRQKQEQSEILKQIENAEKINRCQMAKNVSNTVGGTPCMLPHMFYAAQQTTIEDPVENSFKKSSSSKEHAIEDLQEYEDQWEAKYKQIDSKMEARMVYSVPSSVKPHCSYVSEGESSFHDGRNFTGLDESRDELNMAYIASPPSDYMGKRCSEEIAAVINQLDQMRIERNDTYEREFKPLLEASNMSKVEFIDKATEVNILKVPTEHKCVEVDTTSAKQSSPDSRSGQVDLMSNGLMAYKRSIDSKYRIHDVQCKRISPDVLDQNPERTNGQESWSSSYWSCPSKFSLPSICNLCDSHSCAIPLVEDTKVPKDCIPLSKSQKTPILNAVSAAKFTSGEQTLVKSPSTSNSASPSSIKSKLSSFVQIVADKYLKNQSSSSPESLITEKTSTCANDCVKMSVPLMNPKVILKGTELDHDEFADVSYKPYSKNLVQKVPFEIDLQTYSKTAFIKSVPNPTHIEHNLSTSEPTSKTSLVNVSDISGEFLQQCHEISVNTLAEPFSQRNSAKSVASIEVPCLAPKSNNVSVERDIHQKPYIFHELSTIQEMDSILTNDGNQSNERSCKSPSIQRNVLSDTSLHLNKEQRMDYLEFVDTSSASLVNAPACETSELAKSIKFVKKSPIKSVPECPSILKTPITCSVSMLGSKDSAILSEIPNSVTIPSSTTNSTEMASEMTIPSGLTMPSSQLSIYSTPTLKSGDSHSSSHCLLVSSPSALLSPSSVGSPGFPYTSSFYKPNEMHLSSLPKYFRSVSSIKGSNISSQEEESQPSSTKTSSYKDSNEVLNKKAFSTDNCDSDAFLPITPSAHSPSLFPKVKDDNKHDIASQKKKNPQPSHYKGEKVYEELIAQSKDYYDQPFKSNETGSGTSRPMIHYNYIPSSENCYRKQNLKDQGDMMHNMSSKLHNRGKFCINSNQYVLKDSSNLLQDQALSSTSDYQTSKPYQSNLRSREHLLKHGITVKVSESNSAYSNSERCKETSSKILFQKAAKVGSSGFTPQFSSIDSSQFRNSKLSKDLIEGTLHGKDCLSTEQMCKDYEENEVFFSESPYIVDNVAAKVDAMHHVSSDDSNFKKPWSTFPKMISDPYRDKSSKVYQPVPESTIPPYLLNSPNPILEALRQSEAPGKLSSQCNTLSNGSSAENLSEMFTGSKVAHHQSTPVKTIDEMTQATLILDEPELTLVNTQFSIKHDSAAPITTSESVEFSPNTSRCDTETTPKYGILQTNWESASLLSFIQHEQSCLQDSKSTVSDVHEEPLHKDLKKGRVYDVHEKPLHKILKKGSASMIPRPSLMMASGAREKMLHPKNLKTDSEVITRNRLSGNRTPKDDYKMHTKRLWNNLEEVCCRRLMKEKQDQFLKNRLKAKSYSDNLARKGKK